MHHVRMSEIIGFFWLFTEKKVQLLTKYRMFIFLNLKIQICKEKLIKECLLPKGKADCMNRKI